MPKLFKNIKRRLSNLLERRRGRTSDNQTEEQASTETQTNQNMAYDPDWVAMSEDEESYSSSLSPPPGYEVQDLQPEEKRDPSRMALKRNFSAGSEPTSPKPPALKRRMSNHERTLDRVGDLHVNTQIAGKVSLQVCSMPDHTYSAVAFNIHALPGGNVIFVKGFGVAGLLRRMRVFIRMNADCNEHRDDITKWTCVYDQKHEASWKHRSKLCFEEFVVIPPGENCAFYVHSDYPDDRGLKYRSCHEGVVHTDEYIAITKGYAHTSPIPFDDHHGWYRENRVLSGDVYYEAVPIMWSNYSNDQFPQEFQEGTQMLTDLLDFMDFTPGLIQDVISFCSITWFDKETPEEKKEEFIENLREKFVDRYTHRRHHGWYYGDYWQ